MDLRPYHFTRVFKKTDQLHTLQIYYFMRHRSCKVSFKNSVLSVKEIASKVGYHTEISFINAFTQKFGISPRRFRKYAMG
ncbi:MAG: helix-turn-helix domain-containing protein [Clostridia bacterium]|nr:helix-turn-helix domain-containing protein [Clostridia bacterium]